MNNSATVLSSIIDFLFGAKYYANIIVTRGTTRHEMSSFIFRSRANAERHKAQIASTASYQWVETVSFRSRNDYPDAYGQS